MWIGPRPPAARFASDHPRYPRFARARATARLLIAAPTHAITLPDRRPCFARRVRGRPGRGHRHPARTRARSAGAAVVGGARVSVRQTTVGLERETATGPQGTFVVTDLPPGSYVVRVRSDAFAEREFPPITLQVGQNAEVTFEAGGGGARREGRGRRGSPRRPRRVLGRAGGDRLERHRAAAPQRAELPGAGVPHPRQRSRPELRPTKTNSVLVSSAGQLGRGGNITLDGADNNDDVVGRPAAEPPPGRHRGVPDRHQPLLRRGRALRGARPSTSSPSRGRTPGRGRRLYLRDKPCRGCPPPPTAARGRRPSTASSTRCPWAARSSRGKLFWFGAAEYRNQDGALLVGERDLATRTILRSFAAAPLDDFLGTTRLDWTPQADRQRVSLRYSIERADDTGSSALDRSLGSASQRQAEPATHYHAVLGNWTRVVGSRAAPTRCPRAAAGSATRSTRCDPGRPAHLPEHPGRRVVPRAAGHGPGPLAGRRHVLLGRSAPTRCASAARCSGSKARSTSACSARAGSSSCRTSPQFDLNGDGRVDDNDLLFAVTLRSGFPDRDLEHPRMQQHPLRLLRAGRLARPPAAHPEPRPPLRAGHRRQERQPLRRDQPAGAAVPLRRAQARQQQLGAAHRLQLGDHARTHRASTAATASTTTA